MADEIASLKVVIEAEDRASAVINGIGSSLNGIGRATTPATRAADTVAASWQNTGSRIKDVGASIDSVTKPIQVAAVALAAGGAASAKFAIDFEDSFAGVKKTVEGTPEQLAAIKQGIIDLTTTGINGRNAIPKTTTELNELAAAGGQLGIQTENILGFTETMAQLDTATNLHGESGAQAVARFMNVTDTSQKNIDRFGSAVVDLGNNFATTEAEIVDMGLDMGATGHTIGMSTQAILGYSTALSSMGVDSAAGGSALQRIWMDMQNAVSSGGTELKAFAKISGKSAAEFKKSWGKDADGAFRDFLKGLNKSEDQVGVLAQLGFNNVRDQRALMALAGDKGFSILTEAINRANTAWNENTALQTEFDAKADTTASKIQIVKNNLTEAGRSLGEVMLPTIADVTGGLSSMAQGFAKMSDSQKKLVINTGATVVGMGLVAKSAASTIKTIGTLKEGFGKLAEVTGLAPKSLGIAGLAITGLAVAVPTVVKWIREAKEAQLDWSDGLYESAEAVTEHYDKVKKLGELSSEVKDLQLVINSDESSTEEIEAAKTRLKEIADILNKDYELHIGSDTSQIDETLKKLSEAELSAARLNASTLNQDLSNKKEDYFANPQKIREYTQEMESAQDKATRYGDALSDAQNALSDFHKFENDYEAEHGKSLFSDNPQLYAEKWQETIDKVNDAIKDTDLTPLTPDDNASLTIDKLGEDFNSANDKAKELEESIGKLNDSQKEFESARDSYISAGLTEIMSGNDDVGFNYITRAVQDYGAAVVEAGAKAAVAKTGFSNLNQAIENGKIDDVVNNYKSYAQELGASNTQIAQGAALIKNGFTDMQSAINAGALPAVQADMNALAQSMDSMQGKHIEISAEGDISVIDDATSKVEELTSKNNVQVSVNADGSIDIIDQAGEETKALQDMGVVSLTVNSDGDIDALNEAGEKVAEIDGETAEVKVTKVDGADETTEPEDKTEKVDKVDGEDKTTEPENKTAKVDFETGLTPTSVPPAAGKANFELGTSPEKAPDIPGLANYTGVFPTEAPTIHGTVIYDPKFQQQATGTDYFGGGLAMVNDQTGIADPRELIVDHGQAFIPQGRNVILPLSRGAKVYTASQTKAIMSGMGIPRYAEGKDNSDAFTAARDDWSHYTRTHAVTTTQELEKWVEFSKQFASNEKDIADITEQIFSLTQKQTDELNDQSAAYLELHNALGDWADIGDDPIDAFNRVRARNMAEVEAGRMTWKDYTDTISKMGSDMYDDRISSSRNWLEREKEYHDMSLEDYIAGLERMEAYTREYYDNGIISYREYVEGIAELTDDKIDTYRDLLDAQMDASLAWTKDRTYFNDWQNYGDDPIAAYERVKERNEAALRDGKITAERYNEMMSEMGSELYQGRRESSERWLEEQKKYFGMSSEDYIAGLEREKAYTEEYYRKGLISAREYHEGMTDLNHQIWDEAASAYDDMLSQQSKYMSDMREKFADEEQALRDSWDVEDRAVDMDDLEHQLAIFEGAVTDRGQEQYKSLLKQYKDAQREEELYNLQVRNNAVLEDMQADYDALESAKTDYIKGIAENTDIDVGGYVQDITTNISNSSTNTLRTLQDIITAIKNLDFKMEQQNFSDNRTVTIYSADRYDVEYMAGLGG